MNDFEQFLHFMKSGGTAIPSISSLRKKPNPELLLKSDDEINKIKKLFYELQKVKPIARCLAPVNPRCRNKPIASHSIQRNGPLKLLSENNHVVMFYTDITDFESGPRTIVKLTGLKQATTFPGLCAEHDNEIFSDIEN